MRKVKAMMQRVRETVTRTTIMCSSSVCREPPAFSTLWSIAAVLPAKVSQVNRNQ